ncbi:glycosyltransferase [Halopelagius longus]|uniref:Glycosyltransferase family 1 protein n=1 Tax=Halopelagius longus TaxID=1236180 RepID=A0A1H1C5Y0_9EURY|nr:glycosyltransferase [Halopelagius longus]RDI71081.1 glycosyltransferase family 1 protein [Halopelagius longus]SDQ59534.1 hypothetical protein SAMN05216278_2128 [Halopelagius longus]
MRVLVVPEVYRADAGACGTLRDAATWVRAWLDRDPTLHVYWLLPPRGEAGYDPEDVLADRRRVTLLEARTLGGVEDREVLTDCGYSTAQLAVLRDEIFAEGAYLDAVVDQLRGGRFALYEWLLDHVEQWAASVRPFDVIANVHDLQVPFKYRYCSHRNDFQMVHEMCAAAFADGRWFTAGVDRRQFRERATEFLDSGAVEDALEDAVTTGSPIRVGRFEESYAAEPRTIHLAGSLWDKKNADRLLAIGERLHEEFGIETALTSMESIPDCYRGPEWVRAFPNADRGTYERILREGDLTVCASEYETMARTWFEQAASGQVLVARDEPWVRECVPDGYRLLADLDGLADRAAWAVENWAAAVAANRRLVDHVRETRSPDAVGGRTYADLRRRVESKRDAYESDAGPEREAVAAALDEAEEPVSLDALVERTVAFTDDGRPVTANPDVARTDVRYALRSLGYADTGDPGTPTFAPVGDV